jgi:hypothetical protein
MRPGHALELLLARGTGDGVVAAEPDVLADGEVGEQAAPLQHVADAAAHDAMRRLARDLPPLERDAAGARPQQAGDAVHQRRLPAAVRAEQRDDLARRDGQARAPEHLVVAEEHLEIADFEHCWSGWRVAGPSRGWAGRDGGRLRHAPARWVGGLVEMVGSSVMRASSRRGRRR